MTATPAPELPADHSAMKLAQALRLAALHDMAERAARGHYHDYLSPLPEPDMELLADLRAAQARGNVAATALIARHLQGDFDATPAESDAWAASPDGQAAIDALGADLAHLKEPIT